MPCENCLSRREFLATAAGAAGLAAIAGCGDGQLSGLAMRLPDEIPLQFSIRVSDFPDLATTGRLVSLMDLPNPIPVAVKSTGANTFEALSMRCTHQGCLTNIVSAQTLHCDCHGSNFANDGGVINGPFTGESITPLPKIHTSYDQASDILTIG